MFRQGPLIGLEIFGTRIEGMPGRQKPRLKFTKAVTHDTIVGRQVVLGQNSVLLFL